MISSQIAAMDLAALLAAMLSELEAAGLEDVAVDDVFQHLIGGRHIAQEC